MKIIIFMKNWVGDTFFQFPAIHLIRQNHPNAKILCIAPPRCRELLLANPDISDVLDFDEKTLHRSWMKRLAFIRELRRRGPWDEGYLFHRSKTRAIILAGARVRKRFGYGRGRGFWLTHAIPESSQQLHHVDYFLELLRGCGYTLPSNLFYELPVQPNALQKAKQLLETVQIQQPFVCFHLGANWEPKRWPPRYFAELAKLIHAEQALPIVVTGSANDQPLWEEMKTKVGIARVVSLMGQTSLDSLAALYSQASFVVSGDSGPMHIAASVGVPVVALFGPTNPALTGPRGKGDALVLSFVPQGFSAPFFGEASLAQSWLENISPRQVFEAIQKKGWFK